MPKKILQSAAVLSSTAIALGISLVVSTAVPAEATPVVKPPRSIPAFGYNCVTVGNTTGSCQPGQNVFQTKVTQYSRNQVLFSFKNLSPTPSTVSQISFTDTGFKTLASVAEIFNMPDVNFSNSSTSSNGQTGTNTFNFTNSYTGSSTAAGSGSSFISILFNVVPGFGDPFNAVVTDLRRSTLSVGIQTLAFAGGADDSFANGAVPEPMTILGSGMAFGFAALLKRRKETLQKSKS